MKMSIYITSALFIIFSNCMADDTPSSIIETYHQIVTLIKGNDAQKLAELIDYPLKRQNPLPDINTPSEFVSYYSKIFDGAFKKKFEKYADSCIFEHNGAYGLVGGPFSGEIWLTEEGKIMAINYLSTEEAKLKDQIITRLKNQMHPSVRDWQENIFVGKYKNLIIRIDATDKGLRYVSWSKGHSMSDKPDLILYNGTEEAQGTMGGWTWTFVNKKWTYVIDDVQMCEDPEQCGFFLRLLFNDEEKSTMKLVEVKQ